MHSTVSSIYSYLIEQLLPEYGQGESQSLADILLEDMLEITRTKRLTQPNQQINPSQQKLIESALIRLKEQEPIQHIVGFAQFCGHRFIVTPDTLIPRPETEELVYLVAKENKDQVDILDIGTGTGCIPISLQHLMPEAKLYGWDISDAALKVAEENNKELKSSVQFKRMDALDLQTNQKFDIVISNPPYIPETDKSSMHENVLNYEPELALFVDDEDPLLFYRKIGEFGASNLNDGGKLYFEIHERFGEATHKLLESLGYKEIEIIDDINGKNRMIKALI